MDQDNFGMAVIPAMAGFFLFGKRVKVQEIQEEKPFQLPAVIMSDNSVPTGVTRYLMASPLVTSVTKYMKKMEKQPTTGVAKYVLRQTIAERNAPAQTGVSKYLSKVGKAGTTLKRTTVDKYLLKQELSQNNIPALTGVAKYEAELNLVERKKAAAVLIQRYREQEETAALAASAAAAAAYELVKQSVEQIEQEVEMVAVTGVGKYFQKQTEQLKKKPKATSVSKYIAKKIVLDSQKPTISLSKVGKYLRAQELAQCNKSTPTGVAKYLSKQQAVTINRVAKQKLVESGVARYLTTQAVIESKKPMLSGVARYMKKQAQNIQESILSLPDHSQDSLVESVLEGEFIPAKSATSATGVSKYLEKQSASVTVDNVSEKDKETGVSRYLNKQSTSPVTKSIASAVTGVDRYLSNKAA
jgi:hypothetical protein